MSENNYNYNSMRELEYTSGEFLKIHSKKRFERLPLVYSVLLTITYT